MELPPLVTPPFASLHIPVAEQIRGPQIDPLPARTAPLPFFSVMIPVYNRRDYLQGALASVLEQDLGAEQMHIEVVDDASPDVDFADLVKSIAGDRVSFYRQPRNLGLIPNWNACVSRSRGRWVHLLHDDDIVLPGFYQAMQHGLQSYPAAGSGFCRHDFIDTNGNATHSMSEERSTSGILENWIDRLAVMQRVQFASVVVRRDVYETLGGFRPDMRSAADWEMWKRIAAHYPVFYEPRLLARFRLHGGSESSKLNREGNNTADTLLAIEGARVYLPPAREVALTAAAREHYASMALALALELLQKADFTSAGNQIHQAMQCSASPRMLHWIAGTVLPQLRAAMDASPDSQRFYSLAADLITEARDRLAACWRSVPPNELQQAYEGDLGQAHRLLQPLALSLGRPALSKAG